MQPPHPAWLEWFRAFWPVAVVLASIVVGTGFLWLGTKFALRTELAAQNGEIKRLENIEIKGIHDRIDGHHTRIALVENDCGSSPSKGDLNHDMAVLAGRISGVESAVRGLDRTFTTQHDIQRTLLEQALRR